jgi:hypothetical protein
VRQKTPRSGVSLGGEEVSPVLADQPCADESRAFGAVRKSPEFGDPSDQEDCEDDEPQDELVDAKSTHVDARAKPMPFEAQHAPEGRDRQLATNEERAAAGSCSGVIPELVDSESVGDS